MSQNPFEFTLYPKQQQFLSATEREVLYAGGSGSGKSHALVIKMFVRANRPGAIENLYRKFSADIDSSFLEHWRKIIPETYNGKTVWSYNDTKRRITLEQTGGVIYLCGVGDKEQLGSKEMSGCAVEEAHELTKTQWTKLLSLCRKEVEGIKPQIYGCCNPSKNPYHWMISHFDIHGSRNLPNRLFIKTNVYDIKTPEGYVDNLESFEGGDRQRLLYGDWVTDSGQVFSKFSDEHIKAFEGDTTDIVVGVDDGFTDPFVALKLCLDSDRRVYVEQEFYRSNLEEAEKVNALRQIGEEARTIIADNCAASLISAIRSGGLPVLKSSKGIQEGFTVLRNRLVRAADGNFRLYVNPSCRNLIRELRTYSYKEDGSVEKGNNHAIDALIYALFYLDSGKKPILFSVGGVRETVSADREKETIAQMFERKRQGNIDFGF